MKYVLQLLCLSLISIACHAQNLVANPGFDIYSVCPASAAQLSRCVGWTDYNTASADYFNACNSGTVGVPSNQFGYEMAAGGNGYVGVQDYSPFDYKEYITTNITALVPGATYDVSIMVSLADNAQFASNGLGVYFFKNAPSSVNSSTVLQVSPQVPYKDYGPIANKSGWKKLTHRFTADSAYDHLVIGGFLDNASITSSGQSSGSLAYSYYYIDSVVVRFADTVVVDVTGSNFCAGDNMQVNYTINNAVHFNTGNIFTAQLSNSVGNFASPINIGTAAATTSGTITVSVPGGLLSGGGYRVRIVSSDPAYISSDNGINIGIGNAAPVPTIHITSPVCEGDTVRFSVTSTTNMTNAKWSGPGFNNTEAASITLFHAAQANAGTYTVDAYNYGCKAATISGTLFVNPAPPKPLGQSNSPVCAGDTLRLTGTTLGANDTWFHNGNSYNLKNVDIPDINVADSGLYVLSTWLNGCAATDSMYIIVKPSPLPAPVASTPCAGDTLVLSTSFVNPMAAYTWSGPNGYSSNAPKNYIFSASTDASGSYRLSITDTNGCKAEDSVLAIVKSLPQHSVIAGQRIYCEGNLLELDANNISSAVLFNWIGPAGYTATGGSISIPGVAKSQDGIFTVITNLNGCTITDTTTITVKHTPAVPSLSANTPLFAGDDLQLKINNIEAGVNYTWNGPGGFQANGSPVSIPNAGTERTGSYVVVAEMAGCLSSNMLLITIDRRLDSSALVVYPNWNNGDFIIKASVKSDQEVPIVLFNDKGQLIYKISSRTVNKMLYQPVILHGAVADGVYLLKLYVNGERSIIPIVIRN